MTTAHDLFIKLETLVSSMNSSNIHAESSTSTSTSTSPDNPTITAKQSLSTLKEAYQTLQLLTKHLKPTIDNFFDSLIDDNDNYTDPESDPTIRLSDEVRLSEMNAKLDVLRAFCPGICLAYRLELEREANELRRSVG